MGICWGHTLADPGSWSSHCGPEKPPINKKIIFEILEPWNNACADFPGCPFLLRFSFWHPLPQIGGNLLLRPPLGNKSTRRRPRRQPGWPVAKAPTQSAGAVGFKSNSVRTDRALCALTGPPQPKPAGPTRSRIRLTPTPSCHGSDRTLIFHQNSLQLSG